MWDPRLVLVFLLVIANTSIAAARDMKISLASGGSLDRGKIYQVSISCTKQKIDIPDYINKYNESYRGARSIESATHMIFLSSGNLYPLPDKLDTNKAETFKRVIHAYTASSDSADNNINIDQRVCSGFNLNKDYFFVAKTNHLYVSPIFKSTNTNIARSAVKLLVIAKDLISPLITLATREQPTQVQKDVIKAGGDILEQYEEYLKLFGSTYKESYTRELKVGTTTISTSASIYYITVSELKNGFIADGNSRFSADYYDMLNVKDGFFPDLSAVTAPACRTYMTKLARHGFTKGADLAYIMFERASNSTSDKNEILSCLQFERVIAGFVKWRHLYEDYYQPEDLISDDDISAWRNEIEEGRVNEAFEEAQKALATKHESRAFRLMKVFGRTASTGKLQDRDKIDFARALSDQVIIEDDTLDFTRLNGKFSVTVEPNEFADVLIAKGYNRLGCFSFTRGTGSETFAGFDEANAMVLAGFLDEKGKKYRDTALGLRLFYKDEKIHRIILTEDHIDELIAARETIKGCSSFVERPAKSK